MQILTNFYTCTAWHAGIKEIDTMSKKISKKYSETQLKQSEREG
jgi:hypothetical protein